MSVRIVSCPSVFVLDVGKPEFCCLDVVSLKLRRVLWMEKQRGMGETWEGGGNQRTSIFFLNLGSGFADLRVGILLPVSFLGDVNVILGGRGWMT